MNKLTPYWMIIHLAAVLWVGCSQKNDGFTIHADIHGLPDSTQVMLQNLTTGLYIDSAMSYGGKFIFAGQVENEPEELRIISDLQAALAGGVFFYTDLLIGNESVRTEAALEGLPYNTTSSGSPSQAVAEAFNHERYRRQLVLDSLRNRMSLLNEEGDEAEAVQVEEKLKQASAAMDDWKTTYLEEHFDSYFALLQYTYRRDFETEKLRQLFKSVPEVMRLSQYGRSIQLQLDNPVPDTGDDYHDLEAIDLHSGKTIRLSDVQNKYILLQFAGTGCYGSNLSVEAMKEQYEHYRGSVEFVSFFFEPNQTGCESYVVEHQIPWLSLWTEGGKYGLAPSIYGINGTPTFYLIDPDRRVVDTWFGYEEGMLEARLGTEMIH